MKRNVIGQCAAALFCAVLARFVGATCVATDNPASACRYPAGDAWCVRNGGGNLYAYKDGCAEAQEPTESHLTTRPPPRVAWKPVAVWNCDQAKTVVEHLVCAAPEVHAQDVRMGALYAQLQARGLAPEQVQKTWLKKQREACDTVDCLRAVYAERIGQLEDLLAAAPTEALTPAVSPAPAAPPSVKATATAAPPAPTTPANRDVEAVPVATAQAAMPAVGPPTSVPESTIPQLPLPELRSPATTVPAAASPTSKGHGLAVSVFAVALVLALGLFAWRRRSRTSGTQPAYVRLLALVRGLGGQRQPRARTASLRLAVETRERLNQLRRSGESEAEVIARAVAALEAAGSLTSAGTVTTRRLDTLETRLQRLEGSLTGGSHPDIKG